MKDCEYFEQLISDSLDTPLEKNKRVELEFHLEECMSCREFREAVVADSRTLKSLPDIEHNKPSPRVTEQSKVRRAWMSSKVPIPLPLAASVLIILIGWGAIGWLRPIATPDQKVTSRRTITNVHIERLEPAQPVFITSSEFETKGR